MGKRLFWIWNEGEKRVRAGWRVLFQIILTVGLLLTLSHSDFFTNGKYLLARIEISMLLVAISVLLFMTHFLDRRGLRDLGINFLENNWWTDFGFGIFLGFLQTIVVSLGGANGINAMVLYSAPLTATGNITQTVNQLNILGLLMQIPIILLLLAWVYWRYGMIRLKKELTIYSFRESLLDKHETRIIKDGILKDALK